MELEDLFKDRKNEVISAFAFNVGRMLETAVKTKVGETMEENKILKAQILQFRQKIAEHKFGTLTIAKLIAELDSHFNIQHF